MEILPSHHYQFSAFLTSLGSLLLVILVYKRGVDQILKRQFALYYASLFLWSFSVFVTTSIYDYSISYLFCQTTHIAATMIPVFFLHFTFVYLRRSEHWLEKLLLIISYLVASFFILIIAFFRQLFFNDIVPKLSFPYFPNAGFFYTPWVITFTIVVLVAHLTLFEAMLSASGIYKKQLRFFLFANLIGYCGGIGCFLPVYNLSYFPFPYGPYGVFLLSLVSGYAVLKYRLINLQIFIKNTIVFTALFASTAGIFAFVVFIFRNVLDRYINVNPFLTTAVSVFIIITIYEPLRTFLINATDRFLFQKKYDYQKFLKEASRGIAQIESLDHLLGLVTHFITMRMRLRNAAVLMHNPKTGTFDLRHCRGHFPKSSKDQHFLVSNPLIQYLNHEKEVIEIEQIKEYSQTSERKSKSRMPVFKGDYEKIQIEMDKLHAACCVPSFLGRELKSILILGEKKSGDAYSPEDLNVLFTLAQESAIAIENARLYDEAINRSKELQKINEELSQTNQKLQVTQASLIVAEKNATMVNMAKAIGHEVNNPLTALMLLVGKIRRTYPQKMVEILNRNTASLPEGDLQGLKEVISEIESASQKADRSAQRINAVVHTLTNILKNSKDEVAALSLLVLCREAIEATRFSTSEENLSGCEIVQDTAANILILGNVEQLLQVFVNLIKNSYEAMGKQKNRKIVIFGDIDPQDPQMARIEISDNGPGIPQEVLPKIWNQGFSTKTKKSDSIGAAGQGQGLFVCKHIIESIHKGVITVESIVGKGTKFIIKLPLAEVHADV